jgi:hypothetical protein
MMPPFNHWSLRLLFAIVLALLSTPVVAGAQVGYLWTFEERHAKADLIVIADPIATKDTGRRTVHPSLRPDLPVIELETELKVLTTLKGQSDPVIRLKHYRIDMDEWRRRNGADSGLLNAGTQLSFDVASRQKTAFLLFLTPIDGGQFEPLSGHTFPTEAVFRLTTPAAEGVSDPGRRQ